jgi:DNA repair exonuclease SbcCD nuclease subunit
MDLLNSCNLLNYFGKAERVDDIELYPILIRKGTTKLALYGLGNIRDERLHRTFKANKVKWCVRLSLALFLDGSWRLMADDWLRCGQDQAR